MAEVPQQPAGEIQNPLEIRFYALTEDLETRPPNLPALNEYFRVGAQYFHQEAQKGGENHEEMAQRAMYFDRVNNGDAEYKWIWCLSVRKFFLEEADQNEQAGETDLATNQRERAEHWLELSYLCRRKQTGESKTEGDQA